MLNHHHGYFHCSQKGATTGPNNFFWCRRKGTIYKRVIFPQHHCLHAVCRQLFCTLSKHYFFQPQKKEDLVHIPSSPFTYKSDQKDFSPYHILNTIQAHRFWQERKISKEEHCIQYQILRTNILETYCKQIREFIYWSWMWIY